jgi:hypothetical protein
MTMLNAMRAGYGFARLIRPQPLADRPSGDDTRAGTIDRLLGTRHLAQAIVSQAAPTNRVLVLGAGVDLVHVATMLAAAGLSARRRRAALAEAVAALAFAMAGILAAQRAQPCPTDERRGWPAIKLG